MFYLEVVALVKMLVFQEKTDFLCKILLFN